ncbi:uncharacterized protein LOC132066500 [Lycium ferocissimum]|uniref:uncharacterized protein LOC132066500 n=1 Tax=Lycium ferocissimum TaxID=112874 RepID=UPI0028163968|nr:uncharacterized protein LOC132066500 [Lycium ferocissimum]
MMPIIEACLPSPVGGHHSSSRIAAMVLQNSFYWPIIYQDARDFVKACDQFQRRRGISRRHELPMTPILKVEYILVAVDYVSKWVKSVALPNNEGGSVTAFLKKYIFSRFGSPRAINSDRCSHLHNLSF